VVAARHVTAPVFNPAPRIQSIPLFDGHACHVVDDALLEPQRLLELAVARRADFEHTAHNAYPGPELRMDDAASARLDEFFSAHIRALLGARRTERMYSRLAMVTLPPTQLQPRQWICHRDRFGLPPELCVAASVLYLFADPALGGTSFFRPLRPLREIELMVHHSGSMAPDEFARSFAIRPGYPGESNHWFEKVATIEPRFNRMIFYDGGLFHCGAIGDPARLSDDPHHGRLTLNGFFTCRRRAA
jgi:hypothetical protein